MADAGDDLERPLIAHLLELRSSRLLRGFVGLVVVLVCLLPFSNKLYALLAQPLLDKLPKGGQLIATQVASPFFAPMKLAFFAALMLSMPWLLYQAWAFVAPACTSARSWRCRCWRPRCRCSTPAAPSPSSWCCRWCSASSPG